MDLIQKLGAVGIEIVGTHNGLPKFADGYHCKWINGELKVVGPKSKPYEDDTEVKFPSATLAKIQAILEDDLGQLPQEDQDAISAAGYTEVDEVRRQEYLKRCYPLAVAGLRASKNWTHTGDYDTWTAEVDAVNTENPKSGE